MGRGILAHLIVPVGNVVEALSVGDVIDYDNAVGVAVVAVGDGPEPLLSSSVPLGQAGSTSTSLTLSPSILTVFVFWLGS